MCYWKLRQVLLQITTSVHAEWDYCSKVREFYNKVRQVLQTATIITKYDKTNTSYTSFKWDHSFCLEISLGHFSKDMFHSVLEHEHMFICKPDRLKEIYRNNTILEISDQDMFYFYLEEKINRGYLQAIPSFKIDRTEILNYFPECWNQSWIKRRMVIAKHVNNILHQMFCRGVLIAS